MPDRRFIVISYQQPSVLGEAYKILVDTVTGVNYLQIQLVNNSGASITPLLGPDGKPIVFTKEEIANLEEVRTI